MPRNSTEEREETRIVVLQKALAILDSLAKGGPQSAAALATFIGEPRSSVYRLLAGLQEADLVEKGDDRSYRLGLGLLRLGSVVMSSFDERQIALPVMERIHETTGETVYLCVRRGDEAVCIERLDGKRVQSLDLKLGGSLPLHAGAASRVLLAFAPEEFRERYVREANLINFTPQTHTTAGCILQDALQIRLQGYAISDQDVTPGIAAVGAPLFGFSSQIKASLSISGIRESILGKKSHATELIVDGAMEISRKLGYGGE